MICSCSSVGLLNFIESSFRQSTSLFYLCAGVQVETAYGTVEGQTITLVDDYHAGIAINSFYAVPYARPPVGDLRFEVGKTCNAALIIQDSCRLMWVIYSALSTFCQAPEEPDSWEGVFVADSLGSACSQSYLSQILLQQPDWRDYSEDCLHMNIFAPAVSWIDVTFRTGNFTRKSNDENFFFSKL